MKAKRKPIDVLTPDELGVDVAPRLKILKVEEPPSGSPASRSQRRRAGRQAAQRSEGDLMQRPGSRRARQRKLAQATLHAVTAAAALDDAVDVLVAGQGCRRGGRGGGQGRGRHAGAAGRASGLRRAGRRGSGAAAEGAGARLRRDPRRLDHPRQERDAAACRAARRRPALGHRRGARRPTPSSATSMPATRSRRCRPAMRSR